MQKMRQPSAMLWQYLGQIFAFAFRRTTPAIDGLQVVAASAIPAFAKLMGVKMASDTANDALAYIGFAAIAFIILRLLSAPYFIWREQTSDVACLKHELNRPERLEQELLMRKRAKFRIRLSAHIYEFYMQASSKPYTGDFGSMSLHGIKLVGQASTSVSLQKGYSRLIDYSIDAVKNGNEEARPIMAQLVNDLNKFLHHEITAEDLALRLPPGIELEKQL